MSEIELISDANIEDLEGNLPEGVRVVYKTQYQEFNDTGGVWHVLQLIWNSQIPGAVIAGLIVKAVERASEKKASNRPIRLLIERTEIEFDAGKVTKFIEERTHLDS
jgi:hypothetical protein